VKEVEAAIHEDAAHAQTEREEHLTSSVNPQLTTEIQFYLQQ
jgi:hypothetical protein